MRRRSKPPTAVLERLDLAPGDRAIAWAEHAEGHLVATLVGLWEVGDAGARLLGWDEIDRVDYDTQTLVVTEAALQGPPRTHPYRLGEQNVLPDIVRDRVQDSIVVNSWYRLSGGAGVRVIARRRHGEQRLRWRLAFDRPGDAADPARAREAQAHLAVAQESVGRL